MKRGIPEGYVECSRCKMMTKASVCRCGMRLKDEVACEAPAEKQTRQPAGPNKTEAKYAAECLRGLDARYEAISFRLANGHRYTPDWVVFEDGRPVSCHEVKGSHRFGSHQRARLAFDQARIEIPGLLWVWAVLQKDGSWKHTATRPTPGKVGTDGTGTGKELGSAAEGRKGRFRANGAPPG